jgi:hypothetical protein
VQTSFVSIRLALLDYGLAIVLVSFALGVSLALPHSFGNPYW